jgi:integrase
MRVTINEMMVKNTRESLGQSFIRDDKVIGFALRTTANGFKSFIAEGRVKGQMRRFVIGPADRLTVVEARAKARTILADMTAGVDPQTARKASRERSMTLGVMLDEYLEARSVKASSATRYRGAIQRTLGDWLDKPIAEITPAMVRLRYETLCKRSISDANNAMRVLRAVSRRAMVVLPERPDGTPAIKAIPTAGIAGVWETLERRSTLLEPDEVGRWLQGVERIGSERSRRALTTLLLTGLRVQEALGLQWEQVDEGKRRLTIADSKTGEFTKIIGPNLATMFAEWRTGSGSGLVFGVGDLRSALNIVVKNGGKAIIPHDLRRTYASFAERAGIPFTTLKVLLNHSTNANVTMGYVRVNETDLLHWANVVEARILAAAHDKVVVPFIRQGERSGVSS